MSRVYRNYRDLAEHETLGKDYRIVIERRADSSVAVVAPHGGSIEPGTSEIASAIAGVDFSLYLFEGTKASGNYAALHLPSPVFDEPTCLSLLRESGIVLTVHGYDDSREAVHVGGLDTELAERVACSLAEAGFEVVYPSTEFPGRVPANICNRGRTGRGVQVEFSVAMRERFKPNDVAASIRRVLCARSEEEVSQHARSL